MNQYFNINLEFDHDVIHHRIRKAIESKKKGYVCVVDGNVLTISQKDKNYQDILNSSFINTCDGSSIAWLSGIIHKKKLKALNGPEIFEYYIEKKYKQLLLGSTESVIEEIKQTLKNKGVSNSHLLYLPLPFLSVKDFNYKDIACSINALKPEIIWVSLGAPKQEIFMSNILSYLNSGIMFGIGAAFNFYIGKIRLPQSKLGSFRFIWVSRILREPKKQLKRIIPYILMLPKLYFQEKRKCYRIAKTLNKLY